MGRLSVGEQKGDPFFLKKRVAFLLVNRKIRGGEMTKRELKEMLHYYSRLHDEIASGKRRAKIIDRGRNKTVIIPEWAYLMEVFITEISEYEKDKIFSRMIEYSVIEGKNDKDVLSRLPLSESGYYRQKRKFEEKLYELFIAAGYVSREEILKNKITE